jgi:MarC family membrane protein
MSEILKISFALFLMMDPVGNIPLFISQLKGIPLQKQRKIIIRELLIALFLIIIFNFLGESLFNFLDVSQDTIQITGGIVLFLIAIKMTFPPNIKAVNSTEEQEPFIVPLAIPLVAGPSILAAVMLYSSQVNNNLIIVSAIMIAWIFSLAILIFSPTIARFLKDKGIIALERLMGLILVMIAVQMFLEGIAGFITHECLTKTT